MTNSMSSSFPIHRMFLKLLLIAAIQVMCEMNHVEAAPVQVSCEYFSRFKWAFLGTIQVCVMKRIHITTRRATILSASDFNVGGLSLYGNKNVHYLLENVGANFPNLLGYDAGDCAIKSIERINFQDLLKLRELMLQDNQLETIESDTFKDLIKLERLHLRKIFNQIFETFFFKFTIFSR